MDQSDQLRITKNYRTLTTDLDVKDIVDYLIQDGIFSLDDVAEIRNKGVRRASVEELLAQLPRKGPKAYACFREALQHQYPWLVKQLDATDVAEAVQAAAAGLDSIKDTSTMTFMRIGRHETAQKNWRMLGVSLGVTESDLVNIEYEAKQRVGNLTDIVVDTLTLWKQNKASAAKVDDLKTCLQNIGVTSLT